MIIGLIFIGFILGFIFLIVAGCVYDHEEIWATLGGMLIVGAICLTIFGCCHGFINYKESNDRDLARITAVTQEQDLIHTYYKVEVEYLTNTPTQNGIVPNYNIEKDTFYCYYEDKELVEKLKNNLYVELWIISGHKGGYESLSDFGTKLIKDIELKEN